VIRHAVELKHGAPHVLLHRHLPDAASRESGEGGDDLIAPAQHDVLGASACTSPRLIHKLWCGATNSASAPAASGESQVGTISVRGKGISLLVRARTS